MKLVFVALMAAAVTPSAVNAQDRQYLDTPTISCSSTTKELPELDKIAVGERDAIAVLNSYFKASKIDPGILSRFMVLRAKLRSNLNRIESLQANLASQVPSCAPQSTLIAEAPH